MIIRNGQVVLQENVTDTVENGNMFPVTSNAVNGAIGEAINVNYDANTSTSTENRKNAIDHILNTYPTAKLAIVRYYGGYYYTYEIFRMSVYTYIIEIGFNLKCLVTWRSYNGTTQPLLNYFE